MTLEEYTTITTAEPVAYGEVNGLHYRIPIEILSDAVQKSKPIYLRPFLAIIGKTHVLVVADHNAILKLTVGQLDRPVQDDDLIPSSAVSDLIRCLKQF